MSELKACPFCRGTKFLLINYQDGDYYFHENDKTNNPRGCPLHDHRIRADRIDLWNTRTITRADIPEALVAEIVVSELSRIRVNKADSVCLTFRHDFGLLEPEQQRKLRAEFRSWLDCVVSEVQAAKLREQR